MQDTSLYMHVKSTLSSGDYSCKIEQASGSCGAGEMDREASNSNSSVQRASNEDLTELLLALPHETWSVLSKRVLEEILNLVSIEYLPSLLQDEVLHIRGQLLVLKRCHHDRKRVRSDT